MQNKKGSAGIIVAIIVLIAVVALIYFSYNSSISSSDKGRVVFGITDAAANMGSVSKIDITINEVAAHSQTEGWVTLSSTPKTYNLLELKASGDTAVLADVQVPEGNYEQLRLKSSKVVVTDASGSHEAKLPSGELKIIGGMSVAPNTTATATFDFIADESLHVTGNGQYILAPVVQVETREDATVETKANSNIIVKSGDIKTNVKVGMDIEGNVGTNIRIDKNVDLSIGSDNKIKVGVGNSIGLSSSSSSSASSNSNSSGNTSSSGNVDVRVGY